MLSLANKLLFLIIINHYPFILKVCLRKDHKMASRGKSVKKVMEDYVDRNETELDLQDRGIENLLDVPFLSKSASF